MSKKWHFGPKNICKQYERIVGNELNVAAQLCCAESALHRSAATSEVDYFLGYATF